MAAIKPLLDDIMVTLNPRYPLVFFSHIVYGNEMLSLENNIFVQNSVANFVHDTRRFKRYSINLET